MINRGLFTSLSGEWATPNGLYRELDTEFHFELDACASKRTAKCSKFFTPDDDAFTKHWGPGPVFMNPPYGRQIMRWVEKAYQEALWGTTIVCLLPSRTDTRWWHQYCMQGEIRFIKGRLYFTDTLGNTGRAPFPSAIVIFRT